MTGAVVAGVLPVLVMLAALAMGPTAIAVRGMMRPVFGPAVTRRHTSVVTYGLVAGMIGATVVTGITTPALALSAALLGLLFLLAVIDWQWRWLPIEWTLAVMALAMIFALQSGDLLAHLTRMALPALTLLTIRQILIWTLQKEAMGLGDIWLIAGLGAFLQPFESFLLIGFAALSGLAELGLRRALGGTAAPLRSVAYGTHLCIIFVILRNLTPNW